MISGGMESSSLADELLSTCRVATLENTHFFKLFFFDKHV